MYVILRRKHLMMVLAFLLVLSMGAYFALYHGGGQVKAVQVPVTDWGLGFHEEGTPPDGNASPEYLRPFDSYFLGDTSEKKIFITFDAGYENGNTAPILEVLKKHGVPAAFFLTGNFIETEKELVCRMVEEGHIVGNHTLHHPDMSKISDFDAFEKEIKGFEDLYRETVGKEPEKFYRPPQGKFSETNLKYAQQLGYKTIFWSLAYRDWIEDNQPSRDEAFGKLLPRIHYGAVVLLHSTSKTNADILDELLTKWKEMGYTFGSLAELGAS